MLKVLKQQGFILSGDETLQRLIEEDYKSMKYKSSSRYEKDRCSNKTRYLDRR